MMFILTWRVDVRWLEEIQVDFESKFETVGWYFYKILPGGFGNFIIELKLNEFVLTWPCSCSNNSRVQNAGQGLLVHRGSYSCLECETVFTISELCRHVIEITSLLLLLRHLIWDFFHCPLDVEHEFKKPSRQLWLSKCNLYLRWPFRISFKSLF